jgi:CHASE3 domain sensor protein
MADIDSAIEDLKNRTQAAMSAKYRAEATKESAEKQLEQALAILRENFGLDSLSDARAMLAQIENKAQQLIDEAEQKLDAMNL